MDTILLALVLVIVSINTGLLINRGYVSINKPKKVAVKGFKRVKNVNQEPTPSEIEEIMTYDYATALEAVRRERSK